VSGALVVFGWRGLGASGARISVVGMTEQIRCEACGHAIGFFDRPIRMAKQVDVTGMGAAAQRERADGLVSSFHEECALEAEAGLWRRVA
jgi:hypothetical protein